MADYTLRIEGLDPGQYSVEFVQHALKTEYLEFDEYGDAVSATFSGGVATVRMSGATAEVAKKMDGKTYHIDQLSY